MIRVPSHIIDKVIESYGELFCSLSGISAEKCANDVLNEEKVHDQVELFSRSIKTDKQNLRGKRLLEVGSGFGIFVAVTRRDYGIESYGIEPGSEIFNSSFLISREIQKEYGLNPEIIVNASGESIPFPDNHFDLIFSSTVLEHTSDPEQVIREALRVLRPGGYMQFVFPNYGSFFEGHYALPWIPYLNHTLGKLWVRMWGRDPWFIDTLKFTNPFTTKKWLEKLPEAKVLGFGEDVFRDRMLNIRIKDWAGLGKLKHWLEIANKLHVVPILTNIFLYIKSFEPIILTLRKKDPSETDPYEKEIYDLNWPDWVDMKLYGPSSRWLRALIGDIIVEECNTKKIRHILDYGCGEGSATNFLACELAEAKVTGIDRSYVGIQCAEARYKTPNLEFHHDIDGKMLQPLKYDLITCFEVLEHVQDWQRLAKDLAESTNRYLLVSFPVGRMRKFEVNVGHVRNFKKHEFEHFMEQRGFRKLKVYYAGFPFYSPIFREICNITNSGGTALTKGKYSEWQKFLGNIIFFFFRHLSTRDRGGEQFCGLFERIEKTSD